MRYESDTEISDQNVMIPEVAATLDEFLDGDNEALVRMLKAIDITRTDIQQPLD